ncbi:MAG: hypothetical protein K0R59_4361 [Sphingobacterium sp.]|jgi:hypothetical protein|nr:hypothetical protein [Sphingobacterium sp.]
MIRYSRLDYAICKDRQTLLYHQNSRGTAVADATAGVLAVTLAATTIAFTVIAATVLLVLRLLLPLLLNDCLIILLQE